MNHWAHLIGEIPAPKAKPTRRVRKFVNRRVTGMRPVRIAKRRDALIEFLMRNGQATAEALSQVTRYCKNTIKADMAALQQQGVPIASSGGHNGGYRWMA